MNDELVCQTFDDERAVPTVWRETFERIILALMSADPRNAIDGIENVIFSDKGIETSLFQIEAYPASSVSVGARTWDSSIYMDEGEVEGWSVLIDLHIDDEPEVSDLVLSARVKPTETCLQFDVGFVYVP